MEEYEAFTNIPTRRYDCLCCLPTLAVTLWIALSFRLRGPRCSLQNLYLPALDLSLNSSNNPSLFFDISLRNILRDHGVRYGDLDLTFSYAGAPVAGYAVPGFYQGKGRTARVREVVETRGVPLGDALGAVKNGSGAVFRVELEGGARFRFWFWYSRRKGVRVGADVEVDGSGMKVVDGDIRLNTAAAAKSGLGICLVFMAAMFFCV